MPGKNVFVSYKYSDCNVKPLISGNTARDYVNLLEKMFDKSEKVYYYGERDDNDLSYLTEETIRGYLADKIFHTTVTIVLMSPNMYNQFLPENRQWIPWEISYSLKENHRESGLSHMNAIIAVVLPDRNGKYDYAIQQQGCHRTIHTERFFPIIRKNMFNIKEPEKGNCICGRPVYRGNSSYIPIVTWEDFVKDYSGCIEEALDNRNNWESFNICKQLEK